MPAELKQRKQEALFLATERTIPEQNAIINKLIAEGTSKLKSVVVDLDSELVLIHALVTWMEEEGTKFLGKRGGGSAVLLNEDGSNIDPRMFTVHPELLATTDSHFINHEVEKALQKTHNDVKGTLKSWRRPGAGASNHHKEPHGKTRKHCVGLAHCDARGVQHSRIFLKIWQMHRMPRCAMRAAFPDVALENQNRPADASESSLSAVSCAIHGK